MVMVETEGTMQTIILLQYICLSVCLILHTKLVDFPNPDLTSYASGRPSMQASLASYYWVAYVDGFQRPVDKFPRITFL